MPSLLLHFPHEHPHLHPREMPSLIGMGQEGNHSNLVFLWRLNIVVMVCPRHPKTMSPS